ncbi:N-acetylglucosamine kinase [Glycomyces artemisiae]|uniref:N-acetylglucosamine kinase-like BadF-type ATPase n=1 Tax=Glycomyces artemisiae TaxID=1076443 RepID=A0A2T0UP69_9ACTN|nr:BadF/BadG/BcrA/BcrD ATPase family protein [Glycomyces artemisiae]PRY59725.1 N-acetylglucosamine kinase-like BadF-type ATPase [Glycomyces artemisiae]
MGLNADRAFIAVDGGNSKTDAVAATADGRVHAYVRTGTSSPHRLGYREAVDLLGKLIDTVRAEARWGSEVPLARVDALLAGVDLPVEVERLNADARSRGWADEVVLDNDVFALLRAGTSDRNAVAVICGAGMNSVGRNASDEWSRFPALGPTTGDWGGGEDLGDAVLFHAARAEDGRGPATALCAAVRAHFGTGTAEDAAIGLHFGRFPRDMVHGLVPRLFAAADAGDAVAESVVERQAAEIIAMVRVGARRLGLGKGPFTIVGGGGVLAAAPAALHRHLAPILEAEFPLASYTGLDRPPVLGAAWTALDALTGATDTAAHRSLAAGIAAMEPVRVAY